MIDLRSDTVTQPTPEMRAAMAQARVGDDVYGEDPSVNQLQEMAADLMGKPAGLFVPSGTMGNLAAVLAHCQRGEEVIMGDLGHTFLFEGGGVSALGGVFAHTLPNQKDGTLLLSDIETAIWPEDFHHPHSRLVILENTHNRCGGVVLTVEYTQSVGRLVHQRGLFLHLDGARIFNAAVVIGVKAKELVAPADSVTFCLSKGLCAPVGSVLCGSHEFVYTARRIRKVLGGGMRQAGVLAAAGIVALENMIDRLAEDHQRAKQLAQGLAEIPALNLNLGFPSSNMVFVSLSEKVKKSGEEILVDLHNKNIKVGLVSPRTFRLVTHYWISDEDIEITLSAFRELLGNY